MSKNLYDLIAFDMDGTLLNSNKEILQSSKDAIARAVSLGKYISLSTGRNMQELKSTFAEAPNIRFAIAISGAIVKDLHKNVTIASTAIPEDVVLELFRRSVSFDTMIHLHSDESIVQKDKEAHMKDYNMGQYQDMFDALCVMPEDLFSYYNETRVPVYKFNFYCQSPKQREALRPLVEDLPITIAYAEDASLECSALGISKASGLQALCDYLNIPIERSIAVGDAENDLAILDAAGLSVVMANCKEAVKSHADVFVKSNDDGGCAEAIEKYLLG